MHRVSNTQCTFCTLVGRVYSVANSSHNRHYENAKSTWKVQNGFWMQSSTPSLSLEKMMMNKLQTMTARCCSPILRQWWMGAHRRKRMLYISWVSAFKSWANGATAINTGLLCYGTYSINLMRFFSCFRSGSAMSYDPTKHHGCPPDLQGKGYVSDFGLYDYCTQNMNGMLWNAYVYVLTQKTVRFRYIV